jgi:hypothetical protein
VGLQGKLRCNVEEDFGSLRIAKDLNSLVLRTFVGRVSDHAVFKMKAMGLWRKPIIGSLFSGRITREISSPQL